MPNRGANSRDEGRGQTAVMGENAVVSTSDVNDGDGGRI